MKPANSLLHSHLENEKFGWDEQDYTRALHIQQMVSTPGWKVFKAMLNFQREALIYDSKKVKLPNDSLAFLKVIEGFDVACNVASKILNESERQIKNEKVKAENKKMMEEE